MAYSRIILIALFSSLQTTSLSQTQYDIQVETDSSEILKDNQWLSIVLRFKNNTENNLLLYGIGSHLVKNFVVEERACDLTKVGAGLALMVFDSTDKRKYPVLQFHDSTHPAPETQEQLDAMLERGRVEFLEGTRIARSKGQVSISWSIDLFDYHLEKGTYYLKLVYFSGQGVWTNRIGETQIKQDMEVNKAKLFQGCLTSMPIIFTVK
ncbi:MAG TPA: hypothetical protein VIN08_01325 [Ohtaekwangia sp.]|uniref:hypothetical protein n=1 Tax=Ohtaekwangia sp. TaxID=2066019 RepID=UPI002F95E977